MPNIDPKPIKTFERRSEPMPTLVTTAPEAEPVPVETRSAEVRTVRVAKLDQKTVWRVIDMLKTL
jgi:hypothetical protein